MSILNIPADFEKKTDENFYQYIWRIDNLIRSRKYENWKEVLPFVNAALFGDDEDKYRDESAYRKPCAYARHFKDNGVFNSDNEYLEEIKKQKDELYKAKRQMFDQRREYNKVLIGDARADHLTERLVEIAEGLNKERPLDTTPYIQDLSDNEAVLCFADWHYGMTTDNIWNKYDVNICKARVAELVTKAKERILLHKVKKLHILLLGDNIHGSIHTGCRVASEENTCDQIMHSSELIAEAIEELSFATNKVFVYNNYGNHARTVQNKNDSIHSDNMEKIVGWWLKQRLKNNAKTTVVDDEFYEFTKLNVCGYNIVGVHGDLDSVKNLGLTANTLFSKRYGESIDYVVSADKHHLEEFENFGIESVLVRSLCGADDYANDHRLYSYPGQTLMIFNKENGRDANYNIKLH